MSNLTSKKLKIGGMHCTACAINIDFDLEDMEGIINVKTNYAKQLTEVEFDESQTDLEKIINRIKLTGYTASVSDSDH